MFCLSNCVRPEVTKTLKKLADIDISVFLRASWKGNRVFRGGGKTKMTTPKSGILGAIYRRSKLGAWVVWMSTTKALKSLVILRMRWFGEAREGHLGRGIVSFAGDVRHKTTTPRSSFLELSNGGLNVILGRLEVVRKSLQTLMSIEQMLVLKVLRTWNTIRRMQKMRLL